MYTVHRVNKYDVLRLKKVSDILYECGKDMAHNNDLHHWDNTHIKSWIIVALCALRNDIYLVYSDETPVATFQTQKKEHSFLFSKLATGPAYSGCGIGSYCLSEIECLAKCNGCTEIACEVYEQSNHAMSFYAHRGFEVCGTVETLKYTEMKMRKKI